MFCQKLCWFMFDFLLSIVTVFLFFFLFLLLLTENDSNSSTRGAEASTGTQSFGAESNLWTCVHCTFINHPSKVVCEMCSLPQWIALSYGLTDWCFAGETATGTNDCKHPSPPPSLPWFICILSVAITFRKQLLNVLHVCVCM